MTSPQTSQVQNLALVFGDIIVRLQILRYLMKEESFIKRKRSKAIRLHFGDLTLNMKRSFLFGSSSEVQESSGPY